MKSKAIFLFLGICLLQLSCNNKEKTESPNLNIKTTKKFDIEKFNANKVKTESVYRIKPEYKSKYIDKYEYNYIDNDTFIKLSEDEEYFRKVYTFKNKCFKHHLTYNKDSYQLVGESNDFYKMTIGKSREYDKRGYLIKEKNHDENFTFSVYDLIIMMKKKYGIDLNLERKSDIITINRYYDDNLNKYVYVVEIPTNTYESKYITVDGKNGKVLSDRFIHKVEW